MEIWQWIITASGFVATIGGAISIIRKWIKPLRDHVKRVDTLEAQNKRDLERFDTITMELRHARKADQAIYKALSAIMNHMIDGNHIDKLAAARDALSKHIIEHE